MNLFCRPYISKSSTIPLEETLKELSLFKQTKYCFEYIKKQCPEKKDKDLIKLSNYAKEMGIKEEVMNYIEVFYE